MFDRNPLIPLGVFVLVAGCGTGEPTPSSTQTPSATPTVTEAASTPTQTAEAGTQPGTTPTAAGDTPTAIPEPMTPTARQMFPTPGDVTPTVGAFPAGDSWAVASTVAADYSAGDITLIDTQEWTAQPQGMRLSGDTVVHGDGDSLYVFQRIFGGTDTIQVVNSRTLLLRGTVAIGPGDNPTDLVVIGSKGYISLYNGIGILVFDPSTYAVQGTIDLTEWGDSDGAPNVYDLLEHDGKLYAGVQRVDYNANFEAQSPGYVVEIDPSTDTVLRAITLTGTNAGTLYASGTHLLVATPGSYQTSEGGIERVDLETGTSAGYILEESALTSGSLGRFAVAGGVGWLADSGALRGFNLETGAAVTPPGVAAGASVSAVWAGPDGETLWLSDGDRLSVINPTLDQVVSDNPVDLGPKLPYSLTFLSAP